jgi:hypothetical protein
MTMMTGSAQLTSTNLSFVDSIDCVECDADRSRFWASYDGALDPVSMAVVAVVATVENRPPTDLAPLQSAVDTDALQGLFGPSDQRPQSPTTTSFRYEGYEVTVSSEEVVEVTPVADA